MARPYHRITDADIEAVFRYIEAETLHGKGFASTRDVVANTKLSHGSASRIVKRLEAVDRIHRMPGKLPGYWGGHIPEAWREAAATAQARTVNRLLAQLDMHRDPNLPGIRIDLKGQPAHELVKVRVAGFVNCGRGAELPPPKRKFIRIPAAWAKNTEVVIAAGSSMAGDHIVDGDILLIRKTTAIDKAAIHLVWVEGEGPCLKRLLFQDGRLYLVSSSRPEAIREAPEDTEVRGVLFCLIREFDTKD